MQNRLFLIDGHALVFKMYYALMRRPMINSKGVNTSILYGFTKYLFELIQKEHPTHMAVAFDPPGGTFRNEMYPEYKANRDATPQLVIDALEPLCEICSALGLPVLLMKGFEADDVIGSLAKRAEKEGYEVTMVTPDKDYGQLISEHIVQFKPGKSGGESEIVDSAAVCAKYGIQSPLQVIDMLTLCGDTADNVPGVKGVGEVGAGKLIAKYGSVENIYAHMGELSEKQQAMFREAEGHIALSKQLVTIKTDIDVPVDINDAALDKGASPRAVEVFDYYEFGSLKKHLNVSTPAQAGEDTAAKPAKAEASFSASSPEKVTAQAIKDGACAIAISGKRVSAAAGNLSAEGDAASFAELLGNAEVKKYGYELKEQIKLVAVKGLLMDIALMDYVINPEKSHKLDMLALGELGLELEGSAPARTEEESAPSLFDVVEDENESTGDDLRKCWIMLQLGKKLEEKLSSADNDLSELYRTIEAPLIPVLAAMEKEGVRVDMSSLREFADGLRKEMNAVGASIREMADEPGFNILSPKQVGTILFDKLRIAPHIKAKKGTNAYPTDEDTLRSVADLHPIVNQILEYRRLNKLLSTYIEPFAQYVFGDGKIHTTFNQGLTSTGRLSSSKPNLQNIPIRTERGKEIRKAFVSSRPDGVIVAADYSQIELRILAHFCGDQHLVDAFRAGTDIHKATAARIFGISPEEVTPDQRRIAKTANFGIIYGISDFGLAQQLEIPRSEAKKIIEDYFASFPAIRSFLDDILTGARENGYVETLFGRRRYIPDINSRNFNTRSFAERNAINAPIQGTSADIIKLAMIAVDRRIREAGLESRMVLQIHDELVFDAVRSELGTLRQIVVEEMQNVTELTVPLIVECNHGENWLEAH